jgi:hypothetical protein
MRMPRRDPNWQLVEHNSLLCPAQREDKEPYSFPKRETNKHIHTVVDHTTLYPFDASSMTHLAAFGLFRCFKLLQLHCVDFRFVVS